MIEEYKTIIELAGIKLMARDSLGNSFDMTSNEIAWLSFIVSRQDIGGRERALMLAGLIGSPQIADQHLNNKEGKN